MYLIIAASIGGLVVLAAGVWILRGRVGGASGGARGRRRVDLGKENRPPEEPGDSGRSQEGTALEHSKLVIHALLQSVTENVGSLLDDSAEYGDSLERHKVSVKKAMTVAGIRELERVLLTELGEMQTSNAQYREQLDNANAKLEVQQKELEQLQSDTGIDFLTKVPNRRSFDQRYQEELSRAKRYGSTFSLVVIDVDHFKRVNDSYGHLAGDRILRAVAKLVDEQKRTSDFLARYGGEEFVLILPETGADQARVLAEKARTMVGASKFRYDKQSIRITISAGVGEIVADRESAEELFARVDAALYRAKEMGRNRVEMAEGG